MLEIRKRMGNLGRWIAKSKEESGIDHLFSSLSWSIEFMECAINRNKRKFEDEILEVRVAKHTCLETRSGIQLDIIGNSMSAKDSNCFSEDADSVMSVSDDSLLHYHSTSSSVNWSGTSFERSETKRFDDLSASNLFAFPCFEDAEYGNSEYETKQSEASMEDIFCSNAVISNNSVLSSGRWNVSQDAEQGTEKLTIDKEFEQYFSMLML